MLHDEGGSLGPARYAVTDRLGGVSRAPYDALNLGDHVGDDPAAVAENRTRLAAALGLPPARLAFMRQVHGTTVAVVDGPAPGADTEPPEADALVTTEAALGLVVLTADCVPVLLAAPGPQGPVIAAAHAGRKGVQAGVVAETVAAMRRLGARVGEAQAHVGPAVCGRCYEVPGALQAEVAADVPAAVCTTRDGTPGLDLPGAVLGQLVAAGVRAGAAGPDPGAERRAEIAANLARVEERIAAACAEAGRDRASLTLVAVTKTFPAEDVAHLAALGVRDVGENRDQEAAAKVAACRDAGLAGLVWHFVGQLQRNKAGSVATYADVVHSVDRLRLVAALDRAAATAGRRLTALVQVDLRDEPADDGRGGTAPDDVAGLGAAVAAAEQLDLGGVMAVAPADADPDVAFARLAEVAARLRQDHPDAVVVSAGMSGDLEAAVRHGATHLRVGSALLGSRPPLG